MKPISLLLFSPIVILSSAAVGQSAPPIRTVTTPFPPAPIVVLPSSSEQFGPPTTFAITILSGRTQVWSGTLRVAERNYGNANFSQTRNEAAAVCPGREYRRTSNNGSGERLNVRLQRSSADAGERFEINVDWARPLPDCEGKGALSVGVSRPFDLDPGKSLEFKGDGDFVVRISRRE